jgi:hypothetical protein
MRTPPSPKKVNPNLACRHTPLEPTGVIHEGRAVRVRISGCPLRPRIVPCPAEEMTLRQYSDHPKVIDEDSRIDDRTLSGVGLLVGSPAARRVWVANAEKSEGQHSGGRTRSGALTLRVQGLSWPSLARYSMQVHLL